MVTLLMVCSMGKGDTGKLMELSIQVSGTAMKYVEKGLRNLSKVALNLVVTLLEAKYAVKDIKSGDAWAEYPLVLREEL